MKACAAIRAVTKTKNPTAQAHAEAALKRAEELRPILSPLINAGLSTREIAEVLTEREIATVLGGRWHSRMVWRILQRLGIKTPPRLKANRKRKQRDANA